MGYTRDAGGYDPARSKRVKFVLWVVLALNVLVAVAKMAWGFLSGSVAMQADGFHSLFDGLSNVVGLVGMGMASRPADRDHPYGHGKYETYAAAAIGCMLLLAAWRVGSSAIERIVHPGAGPEVTAMSFAVMLGTLAMNVFVTTWERREGRRVRSDVLLADARHTGSDMLVSVGVILGLILTRWFPLADAVVALLVAVAIVYTALQVLNQASGTLSDSARLPVDQVCGVATQVPGVLGCHTVRTRGAESRVYVDLHVQVDPHITVEQGHSIAEQVERRVAEAFDQVADVIVHLEPLDDYQERKTAEERESGVI